MGEIRDRLAALETAVAAGLPLARAPPAAAAHAAPAGARLDAGAGLHPDVARSVPFAGRLLLVLAGAFLLRAATEGGQVPLATGAAAGLAYALVWIVASWRAAARGARLSSAFHALGAALVAYPLVFEAATRFSLLGVGPAVAVVGLVAAAGLLTAARYEIRSVAAVACAGAIAVSAALLLRRDGAVPVSALLVLLAAAVAWLGASRRWAALTWVTALAADGAVLYATSVALGPRAAVPAWQILAVQTALVALHLGAVGFSVLVRRRRLTVFDATQTALVLAIGFRGALGVADRLAGGAAAPGFSALAVAAGAYLVAFLGLRSGDRRTFHYFTTVALVLVLSGTPAALGQPAVPWALLAMAAAWIGHRGARGTLALHGAAYAVAAAFASGLLHLAADAWAAPAAHAWPSFPWPAGLALAAAAVCAALPVHTENPYWRELAVLPKVLSITLLAVAGSGALLLAVAPMVAGRPGAGADAATVAVLRTGVLAVLTVACAAAGRTTRFRPAAWIVYPLLALGPVKLLLEDLPAGRPATLWLSFLLYGSALILAPRIGRGRAARPGPGALAPS